MDCSIATIDFNQGYVKAVLHIPTVTVSDANTTNSRPPPSGH